MDRLKDRTLAAIQKDRLSELIKEADERNSGCFYFSLANIYHFLNPGKILPRNFEQSVLKTNPNLGVKPSEVVERVSELRDVLGIDIAEVIVMKAVVQNVDEIRNLYKVPSDISVKKPDNDYIETPPNMSSMVFWQNDTNKYGHFSSIQSGRLNWGNPDGSVSWTGGQEETDLLEKKGFDPIVVLHFNKTGQ